MIPWADAAGRALRVFGPRAMMRVPDAAIPEVVTGERTRRFLAEVGVPGDARYLLDMDPVPPTGLSMVADQYAEDELGAEAARLVELGSWGGGVVAVCLEPPSGRVVEFDGEDGIRLVASDVACFVHAAAAVEEFLRGAEGLSEPWPAGPWRTMIPAEKWARALDVLWSELDAADPGAPIDRDAGYWPSCVEGFVHYNSTGNGIADFHWPER